MDGESVHGGSYDGRRQSLTSPGLIEKQRSDRTMLSGLAGYAKVMRSIVRFPTNWSAFRLAIGRICGGLLISSSTLSAAPTACIRELKTSPMDCTHKCRSHQSVFLCCQIMPMSCFDCSTPISDALFLDSELVRMESKSACRLSVTSWSSKTDLR